MFASSNVTGVVQNAVKANNAVDVKEAKDSRTVLVALLVSVLLQYNTCSHVICYDIS